ncbi:hypothetical protein Tco_0921357 [Tanacetum coccineum]
MIKEHDQQAKMKATPRKLAYVNSDKEAPAGSLAREDAYEDPNSPYKRPKPTPFTQRFTHFKYHRRAKLPRNIRAYEGNKDPEDHLGIFSAVAEQVEWLMPVCFEELSQKFLEEFSQQKRYAKDPTEIHGIKRRQNEGLQAFMDRFKSESSHIKGAPPVLRISAFMHGHGHPELAKKLNDKIPKMVDEMVYSSCMDGGPEKARNRGGPREARRNMGGSQHQRLLSVKKANRGSCGLGEVGSSGEGHSPEQPAEWESGKERCKGHKHDKGRRKSQEDFEEGRAGRSKTVLMEFAIIKCHSPYNVIIGRTRIRSLRVVGSTIHSIINFPTNQGIVTMETNREALWECRQLERMQDSWKEVRHSVWVANTIPVKLENRTWKVQVDYSSLNNVCAKDMYPFPEEVEGVTSIMGYQYKCFLRLPKEYNQIRMTEDDEEKIGFHMEEGVYCFTHMPKELKNSAATLQRMMEKVLADQRGRNMETT